MVISLKICSDRVPQVTMLAVVEGKRILHRKSSRSGYLRTVAARLNEIDALLAGEDKVECIWGKLNEFVAAFEKFEEAHILYFSFMEAEASIVRYRESFDRKVV